MNFIEYVESKSVKIPWSGCSIWMGAVTDGGYARSIVAGRIEKTTIVHRAIFQHMNGPVLRGLHVCHHCDTPACVNLDHLFIGTPSDNAADRIKKGRSAPTTGTSNGRAKLTTEQVLEIRRFLNDGKAQKEIASAFLVSIETVSQINTKRIWRHI